MFKVGDTVVCPNHGAGRILEVVEQDFQGTNRRYYSIQILHNDMNIKLPVDGCSTAGVRPVIREDMVEEVIGVLRDDATKMPLNWNHRVKHNREKIGTGDVFELADVVRNLALRESEKGLSTGEKQMFGRVKRMLASELMYAKSMRLDDAESFLDRVLSEICAQPRYH
jgi:CarD family transcriptional regulator, regulator of rRNA transcription